MPTPAEYDLSTPLLHPYAPPSQSYRPPPPVPAQPERKRVLSRKAKGLLFLIPSSVVLGAIEFIAVYAMNAQLIADATAVIAGGGTLMTPGQVIIATQADLAAYALSEALKVVAVSIACYYGAAALMFSIAGAKGRLN
jgi:hypothetical protein